MVKSLGDYNKEQSSSSNVNNIKWTKKNPPNEEKPKKKRKNISPTNIIPSKNKKVKKTERVFKIEEDDSQKPSKDIIGKKFQKSSVTNCKIKPGFRRPGR